MRKSGNSGGLSMRVPQAAMCGGLILKENSVSNVPSFASAGNTTKTLRGKQRIN